MAVQAYQAAVDDFDAALADQLGVNRTDLRCLELLLQQEATPNRLGSALGLTSGSVTAMLDRLEKLNYVSRSPDPDDRRKVTVRAADVVRERATALLAPMLAEGEELLDTFTEPQLRVIIDFLERTRELQQEHVERVRAMKPERGAPRRLAGRMAPRSTRCWHWTVSSGSMYIETGRGSL